MEVASWSPALSERGRGMEVDSLSPSLRRLEWRIKSSRPRLHWEFEGSLACVRPCRMGGLASKDSGHHADGMGKERRDPHRLSSN